MHQLYGKLLRRDRDALNSRLERFHFMAQAASSMRVFRGTLLIGGGSVILAILHEVVLRPAHAQGGDSTQRDEESRAEHSTDRSSHHGGVVLRTVFGRRVVHMGRPTGRRC